MRGPYAILTPCGQSHAFEERKAKIGPEDDPLKIGRAVARLKPAIDNAIFDCKVLSRNHAVMYFEDGNFFLKDTKSSNGSFVNNDRLAITGEESEPKLIYSGDILQFGVEIVENSNKVAHGCIFAMIRLFDDKGIEVEAPSVTATKMEGKADHDQYYGYSLIGSQQLFQLQQYLKEALFREKAREEKIRQLEAVLASTDAASEAAWKAGVNEDRLLARIESLEASLAIYSKNASLDKMKVELEKLVEHGTALENTARDNLKRALDDKMEASMKLMDCERSLVATEEECARQRKKTDDIEVALSLSVEAYEKQLKVSQTGTRELNETQRRMEEAENRARRAEMAMREKEETVDDKVRSTLIALASSPRVDRDLLISLQAVSKLMLKEGEIEDVTESLATVIDDTTQRDENDELTRLREERDVMKRELEDKEKEKDNIMEELQSLRDLRQRKMGKEEDMNKIETRLESTSPSFVLPHLPSVLLVSLVPLLGILLIILVPIFTRLSLHS